MMAAAEYYTFTGRGAVPRHVTRVRIDESISVIPVEAFRGHPNIAEVVCHDGVKKVEVGAFFGCPSLRRVIMPGVKEVKRRAFWKCGALADVVCGKLEIIEGFAFNRCISLRSIDLPSVKIIEGRAFFLCTHLTNVKFGRGLESFRERAFLACRSLERITLPLKDGMISENVFQGCKNLKHVDLVEGAILHETTINALQMKEWRDDMNEEIASIKLILPTTPAGNVYGEVGGKAEAVRVWIRSVLHKIVHYKAEHHRYLNEATITLELAVWKKRLSEINVPGGDEEGRRAKCRVKCGADIVTKNVLPFLELPPYTFGGEG